MKSFHYPPAAAHMLYHDRPGAGRPLVFLHGLGCASSCDYAVIAASTALAGRRLILVDLLGSGFSERPQSFSYCIADHALSVAALVASISTGPFDIFGHSMGGSVAIHAATLIADRVANLVLSEPNLDAGGGLFSRKIADMSEVQFVSTGHAHLIAASCADGNVVWASSLALTAPVAAHRSAKSLVAGGSPSWREALYDLRAKRTVIFGEYSLPDADTNVLPQHGINVSIVLRAGHSMAWESPSDTAAAIAEAAT